MILSDDPVADFERLDADLNKKLSLYPTCDYCGKTIQDEYCYVISEETVCCACLDKHFRQEVMPYE
jgi:formylmethanofuran dehydrogenase subunit E